MVVRIFRDFGIPDDLLGKDALAVYDCADLAVAAAGIKADAAAVEVAAHGLGIAVLGRDGVAADNLKGALVHVGHEVGVKFAAAALAVGRRDVLVDLFTSGYIDLEPAHAPEQELDQPVGIVSVGPGKLCRAVNEGVVNRYLAARALYRDVQGLLRVREKCGEEFPHRYEAGGPTPARV